MLTVFEKVIFLQRVDVFSDVPTEDLAYLGAIAEEVAYDKDEVIYSKDDRADSLYIVLNGQVELHVDKDTVAVSKENDVFGTWALFDEEPRVTSATPKEDVKLLRIDKDDFYDLLSDHGQITQAVFQTIVKKLRGLIGKFDPAAPRKATS